MSLMSQGGRASVAGAVISTMLGRPVNTVTVQDIDEALREYGATRYRKEALTYAYFGHLRRPENDRPHNVRARELLAALGADVGTARQEWQRSTYVQGNPWG